MAGIQPTIEDEPKARFGQRQTSCGSLGGLTMPWGEWFAMDEAPVSTEVSRVVGRVMQRPHQQPFVMTECNFAVFDFPPLQTPPILRHASQERRNRTADVFASRPLLEPTLRERELNWRNAHVRELSRYANEWVALEGEEIIAHGSDAADVIREAKVHGIRKPYVFFVEPTNPGVILIGI